MNQHNFTDTRHPSQQVTQSNNPLSHSLVLHARDTAQQDFAGVLRKVPKGSGLDPLPYFSHVERVAMLLAEHGYGHEVIAAGYLHDHLEDLPRRWNIELLKRDFGEPVTELVSWVTHKTGTKTWEEKTRKYQEHLRKAPPPAKAISTADKLANMEDLVRVLKLGYPVTSVLKQGWQANSQKFHQILLLVQDEVNPSLIEQYKQTLEEFDRLGSAFERTSFTQTTQISATPKTIEIPRVLKLELPRIRAQVERFYDSLSDAATQHELRTTLMSNPAWADWIAPYCGAVRREPILIRQGLGFELDDALARVLLVGVAVTLEPKHICPPYSIGGEAVTEVMAAENATALSHSKNDLPAPPHTAGFFEAVPPHTCYFCCIRPHQQGGAATTVLNVARILEAAPQELIEEWSTKPYLLRTSTRMGGEILPFQLLKWIEGIPFLRYRKECMVGFDTDPSLRLLEELVQNPKNHYVVPLQAGETLVHWNGMPHSRLPQIGETPQTIEKRRKLIRCRTVPETGWSELIIGSNNQH